MIDKKILKRLRQIKYLLHYLPMYRSQCTPQIKTVVMKAAFIKGPIMIGLIVQHLYG